MQYTFQLNILRKQDLGNCVIGVTTVHPTFISFYLIDDFSDFVPVKLFEDRLLEKRGHY